MAVYTGSSVDAVTEVASSNDGCEGAGGSKVAFLAVAGTEYHIAVDGRFGAYGSVVRDWFHAAVQPPTGSDCRTEPATIVGTPGDDLLLGTSGRDVIRGLDGDDRILGLEGDDLLCGGNGNDRLVGGAGEDDIRGGGGDDTTAGDAGDDYLSGGDGDDLIRGGKGQDRLDGRAGIDTCRPGSDGGDKVSGCGSAA